MERLFLTLECNTKAAEKRIAVIGDSILDEYITGMQIESDYPIFLPEKRYMFLGGIGNIALNIKEMWDKPYLFSVLGEDEQSGCFKSILNAKGLENSCLVAERPRNICHKTRIVSDNQILIRIDKDYTKEINTAAENQLYNKLKYYIDDIQVVVIANHHKGCLSEDLLKKIKLLCGLKGIKILFTAKKPCGFHDSYLLKIKLSDFKDILGSDDAVEMDHKVIDFKNTYRIQNILITMGEKGAVFIDEKNFCTHLPALCSDIICSCGAGDSMISAIAVCLANNIDINSAIPFANFAAAAACMHDKTYAVSLKDIKELWDRYSN